MHVDDFIDNFRGEHIYARWVLNYFRLPASLKCDFEAHMAPFKLFCTYGGKRFRCTGASSLGDVWLTGDFKQVHGYQNRVDVSDCTEWGDKP